ATDATIAVMALTPGDNYTCTVTATNGVGPSPASPASVTATPIGVPAQPAQPTLIVGDKQLMVTSNTPASNGSTILSYTANCSTTAIGGAAGSATLTAATDAAITVTGLTDGDSYTCTVTATNGVGPSPASPASASATPIGKPAAPAQPTVTQGNQLLVVTYTAPANNGSQITSYTAVCTSTNGGALGTGTYNTLDGTASPINVASVTSGKSYTCHVRATNGVGASPDSLESSPPVTVGGVPGAPSLPTLASGNAQIAVSFVAGAPNGAPVTGNTATCTSTNGGAAGSASGVSPITVTGLTNGANYNCSVVTTNIVGPGPASPTASVVVGLPAGVAQPSVVSGDAQIVVGFVAPSLNGSPLVGYHATCLSAGNPVAFGSGMGSPVVASGAVDGQRYTCQVNAQNAVGEGPDSPASVVVVPAGVPGFPPAPTITAGNNVMHVVFVAPVANGAPITSYTASCASSDGGVTVVVSGPASPINVTGLSDGNTYTCDVSATNSAGTGSISDESAPAVAAGVPAAVALPSVVGGPGRLVVSFGLPAANGSTITSTTATCASGDGGVTRSAVTQPQDVGQTFSPITVTGVTNGKSYTCKVTATNGIGTGPASPVSAVVVPRSPPGVPTGVKAVSGNAVGAAGPVVVSFTAGTANGSAITSFQVTCTDGRNGLVFTKSGPGSPITVGGLSTGHPFSCAVAAVNAGGTSARSVPAAVTLGAPGQPTIARVVQSHHGVTLTVLAPIANGAPISRYVARCTSTNGGIGRGSASSGGQLIVTNMSLGATYTCTVTAYNSRGAGTPTKTTPITITK
ncbi:MAG TPA: fibronectin type III domain-containing protein, partial [Acidimicrobiia bacterium]|nr:fibronectin type III domain-containing protein [Acidimicrobiia bacterium]